MDVAQPLGDLSEHITVFAARSRRQGHRGEEEDKTQR